MKQSFDLRLIDKGGLFTHPSYALYYQGMRVAKLRECPSDIAQEIEGLMNVAHEVGAGNLEFE